MDQSLEPIPFPSTPATRWLLNQTPALDRLRAERTREQTEMQRYRSEASAMRNGGISHPSDEGSDQ